MTALLFHPSIAVGIAGGLGLGILTGRSSGDRGRVVLRSLVSAIALRILALSVGMYAAIGAGLAMAFVAAAITAAGEIGADNAVPSYLMGAFLFGGAIGYTVGAII